MLTSCLTCLKEFNARTCDLKRGYAKYCSRKCFGKRSTRFKEKKLNVQCAFCGKDFYKAPSKLKNSKSGLHFCCREHKDLAQRIGGIKEIQPNHYDKGNSVYRSRALRHYGAYCHRCGFYDVPRVLQVHHIDRNRSNNVLENLEVLCPTCHEIDHLMCEDGRYSTKYGATG